MTEKYIKKCLVSYSDKIFNLKEFETLNDEEKLKYIRFHVMDKQFSKCRMKYDDFSDFINEICEMNKIQTDNYPFFIDDATNLIYVDLDYDITKTTLEVAEEINNFLAVETFVV